MKVHDCLSCDFTMKHQLLPLFQDLNTSQLASLFQKLQNQKGGSDLDGLPCLVSCLKNLVLFSSIECTSFSFCEACVFVF